MTITVFPPATAAEAPGFAWGSCSAALARVLSPRAMCEPEDWLPTSLIHDPEELPDVGGMQADGRLVHDVDPALFP